MAEFPLSLLSSRTRFFCFEAENISLLSNLQSDVVSFRDGVKPISDISKFAQENPFDSFTVTLRLRGGKGGFSSLLRSFRINKSTNQLMCRDLNGRRLADVEDEKKLRKWLEGASEREKEKGNKEKAKYEKLRSATQDKPKHDFNDPDYIKTREEILEKTEDAFDAGFAHLRRQKKRKQPETKDAGDEESDDSEEDDADVPGSSKLRVKKARVRSTEEVSASPSSDDATTTPENSAEPSTETPVIEDAEDKDRRAICETVQANVEVEEKKGEEVKIEVKKEEKKPAVQEVPKDFPPINLDDFSSIGQLEELGLHHLKHALEQRGLKCGGALQERAKRLYSIKGLKKEAWPKSIIAPPPKGSGK